MALPAFGVTYDYRCPFARLLHGHLVAALRAGAAFEVEFLPFTLTQGYVEPGEPDAWDDPARVEELLALEVSLAVRDTSPAAFLDVHEGLFDLRHVHHGNLRDRKAVWAVAEAAGVDLAAMEAELDSGRPRAEIAERWRYLKGDLEVFGVPTFVIGDDAVFVRLLEPSIDAAASTALIEQLVRQVAEQPTINEFKHTRVPF